MSELQIKIKKDKSFRDVLSDFDKIITAIADTIKLDLSNTADYPTLEVSGDMSTTGIVAVATEKLYTPRNINIVGETLGTGSFDGTKDINITTSVTKILNSPINDVFENINNNVYSKRSLLANTATLANLATNATTAENASNENFTIPRNELISGGSLHLEGPGTYKTIVIENVDQVLSIYGEDLLGTSTLTFNPSSGELTALSFNGTATNTLRVAGVICNNEVVAPTGTDRLNVEGYIYATRTYVTESSDYAECFESNGLNYENIKHRIVQVNEYGKLQLGEFACKRVVGIVSDNYGYLLNGSEEDVKEGKKIPVGLAGSLWVDSKDKVERYNIGNLVCSDHEGYAKVLFYPTIGINVGKIIDIDEENNRYKVLISLI